MDTFTEIPSHSQLLLPLIDILSAGPKKARDVVDELAERFGLPPEVASAFNDPQSRNRFRLFPRRVRWVKETAKLHGLVQSIDHGVWALTDNGHDRLLNCRPGVVVVVYESDDGTVLWADAKSAAGVIAEESVDLLITSPPYPLLNPREYGNLVGDVYVEWLLDNLKTAATKLKDSGSLCLNLMPMQSAPGVPTESLYIERVLLRMVDDLKLHLCQRLIWWNPAKMVSGHWTTIKRVRLKSAFENVLWMSKTPHPKVNQRNVLLPYSDYMRRTIGRGGERRRARPSGHGTAKVGFARDNGGSIPSNIIRAASATSNSRYHRFCRQHHLPVHPATFPKELPSFLIKLLTDPGDTVWDCFGGSCTVREVCEELGRNFIINDKSLTYLAGSLGR